MMSSEQHEELSGNPNLQLGGLLQPWPDESHRHWLEQVLSWTVEDDHVVLRCATNRGDEAIVHLSFPAQSVLRLTLYPRGVDQHQRATGCLVADDVTALPLDVADHEAYLRVTGPELVVHVMRDAWELTLYDLDGRRVCG